MGIVEELMEIWPNEVCNSRLLPDTPKLIQIKESISYHMKLEPIADGFLNEFTCCIK